MLRARLFGPLAVEMDGRDVPEIAGLRPRSVLAWMLLAPGPHARAHVAARFWPDVLDTSARASLRNALSTIRAALDAAGAVDYLEADRSSVGISAELRREIDVEVFGQLAAGDDPHDLARAFELANAPLLSDLADDWVLELRDEYRDRLVDVALRLGESSETRGDLPAAIEWTRRALAHARVREAVHRTLMRRLADAGERAEALDVYERLAAILAAEYGTPPSAETRALADALRSAGPSPTRPRAPASPGVEPARPAVGAPPRLVGRDRELEALAAAWERARGGCGGVVLVRGAPGIGKSRLAGELARRATASGGRSAVGAGLELDGAPPLAPWSDVLHELVAAAPPPPADAAWPGDLVRLCHAVETYWGRRPAHPSGDPEFERARLFEAVVAALAWCAREQPLLLVLEDLHLMDVASVALLVAAARRLTAVGVLMVATGRSGEDRVVRASDALARGHALAGELELEPLTESEIAEIVDTGSPSLAADTRRRVVAAAGGMPLLAREAARAAAAGANLTQGLVAWVRSPLSRLSAAARLLVDLTAAAGRPLERGVAAQLVGPRRLPVALEEACRAHLLEARADGRIGFQHTLVRDACHAELSAARRAWLHGDIADVLMARSSRSVAEIARHLLLARRDEEASGYLAAAAADARRLGALDEAAGFLGEATVAAGSAELEAELWLLLADIESWRGDRQAYERAFARAIALLERTGDGAALAEAHVMHARCLRTTLCFPKDALMAYEHALEIIERQAVDCPELRALALAGAAWAEAMSGDIVRAHALIATVESLPEAAEDAALASELELDRAAALMRAGRFAESEAPSRRAAELALEAERHDLHHQALINAAAAAAAGGDPERALELAERAPAADDRRTGPERERVVTRAYALSRLGRHDEARRAARELRELAQRSGDVAAELIGAFDEGSVALAAGDGREAAVRLEAALARDDGGVPRALARLRLAEARWLSGDVDAADRELRQVPFEPVAPADLPDTLVPRLRRLQGLLAVARNEPAMALQRLGQAETGWRRILDAAPSGEAFAATFVDLGRPPVAGLLEPGIELGRVLAERALALAEAGETKQAEQDAAEAGRLASELSFDGYRETLTRAATRMKAQA